MIQSTYVTTKKKFETEITIPAIKPVSNVQENALVHTLGYLDTLRVEYDNEDDPTSATLVEDKKTFIEQHSLVNGFNVRTIPAHERWTNPVIIAAGAGRMAIVDRTEDVDTIKVTTRYAGADIEVADDYLAFPEYDWGVLTDDFVIPIPGGYRVTGLQILDLDTIVATVTASWNGSITEILTYDLQNFAPYGVGAVEALNEAEWNGPASGRMCPLNNASVNDMFVYVMATDPVEGRSSSVLVYDLNAAKVLNDRSLPVNWHPIAITACNNIINVLCRNSRSENGNFDPINASEATSLTRIFRFYVDDRYALYAFPPEPEIGALFRTFTERDVAPLQSNRYADSQLLMSSESVSVTSLSEYTATVRTFYRNLTGEESSQTKLFDRFPSYGFLPMIEVSPTGDARTTQAYMESIVSPLDGNKLLVDADCSNNQATEVWQRRNDDGSVDETVPYFYSVHVSHYDYLSEGGFTYRYED